MPRSPPLLAATQHEGEGEMKDINKVILVGRLGKDPVQRETKTGLAVTHFPLATSRRIRPDGQAEGEEGAEAEARAKEETQWHRVVVWGKQGEACSQFLRKGEPVYVEGTLRSHKYDGKDGQSRVSFEVHADEVSFLKGSASGARFVEGSASGARFVEGPASGARFAEGSARASTSDAADERSLSA
jgi:single-strand DNA-binding protein